MSTSPKIEPRRSLDPYQRVPTWELESSLRDFNLRLGQEVPNPNAGDLSHGLLLRAVEDIKSELARRAAPVETESQICTPPSSEAALALPVIPPSTKSEADKHSPPLKIETDSLLISSISAMDPKALKKSTPFGKIVPPVHSTVGFLIGSLRIPVPNGAVEALSLDPKVNKRLLEKRETTYVVLEEPEFQPPTADGTSRTNYSIDIDLPGPIGSAFCLPAPIGCAVTEYCGEERLALPKAGEYEVLVEQGYQEAAYHISRSNESRTVPFDLRIQSAPTVDEMRYWQAELTVPPELRELLLNRLESGRPDIQDEVFDLITSYMDSQDERGNSLFSYVCHPAVGELLREQGEDLPFVLSELKIGHCDYLAWYACALLRGYGVPAWMTNEVFPTSDGNAFNVACGHARVISWSLATGTERLFDPTRSAGLSLGWLPEVLPVGVVLKWKEQLRDAATRAEKRKILGEILKDVAQRAAQPKAVAAANNFNAGTIEGFLFPRSEGATGETNAKITGENLGVLTAQSKAGGSWRLLCKREAIDTVREIGLWFRFGGYYSNTSYFSVYNVMSEGGNLPSLERRLVAKYLDALHELRRQTFGDYFPIEEGDDYCFGGRESESIEERIRFWREIDPGFGSDCFDSMFLRRQRGMWTHTLQRSLRNQVKLELPAAILLASKDQDFGLKALDPTDIRCPFDLPLAHIPPELAQRHLGQIDTKRIGRLLKRIGWGSWTYDNRDGLTGDKQRERVHHRRVVQGLLTFEVDLQRALASSRGIDKARLLSDYGISPAELREGLATRLYLDVDRPRGIVKGIPSYKERRVTDVMGHFAITPTCQKRVQAAFLDAVRSVSTAWAPQRVRQREDLREYVVGDDLKYLDWKATARRDTPLVKLAPAPSNSLDAALTVVFVPDSTERVLESFQLNEIITQCKAIAKRGRPVFLGSVQWQNYLELNSKTVGIPNTHILENLYSDYTKGLSPGIHIGIQNRPKKIPHDLILVGSSFGKLLSLRELCREVKNCRALWLGAPELDVYPLARPEYIGEKTI